MSNTTKTFRKFVSSRACENAGAVKYSLTETLTETPEGLLVTTVAFGVADGSRVDESSSKLWPGASFEAACTGRLRQGYHEVTA